MVPITGSEWTDVLVAALVLLYGVHWYLTNNINYWDKRGVPCVKRVFPLPVLFGLKTQSEDFEDLYNKFSGLKYGGFFQGKKPVLLVRDLDLIHKVMVKDFTHFQDRGGPVNSKDPMANNLFNLRGTVWRALRYKLTPTFTTGKLKGMFEQVSKCSDNMVRKVEELTCHSSEIEAKEFLFEFTSEVISSCAFGLQFEIGSKDFKIFKQAVKNAFNVSFLKFIKFFIFFISPKLATRLKIRTFVGKEESEYFLALIKGTSKYRRDNQVKRNDYLQLLLTLQEQEQNGKDITLSVADASEDDDIINQLNYVDVNDQQIKNLKLFTDETICANSVVFLIAGSESTSSTVSLTLFELARNPDIQQKLQQEVDEVIGNHSGNWTYAAIKDMTYLDQVVQESQRLYPILPFLMRECTKSYKVPDSDLIIEKGVLVAIPVIGLHKDPQHYPEPDTFKPERFEGNNFKPNSAYLPYGDGPRICIAMRFAIMEVKTAVARIVHNYTIKVGSKTKIPLKMQPRSFLPQVEGGMWLRFERRKNL